MASDLSKEKFEPCHLLESGRKVSGLLGQSLD
jgi:hypothetical protein